MKNLSIENITRACKGTFHGDESILSQEVSGVVIDSRKVQPGYLFVAIDGERVNAHKFIPDTVKAGAMCVVSHEDLGETDFPYILVESTGQALLDIAKLYRDSFDMKVVGITGSVGKTSTKEMIASGLAQKYHVHKTLGNFNNEWGLPITIFDMPEDTEVAVLEMGVNHFGEMRRLSSVSSPDICVITNIGTCHLENLGDRDGVLKAKTEIFKYLQKDGHIVLNGDDDKLCMVKEYEGIKPVFFGMEADKDVYADEITSRGLKGMTCRIHIGGESFMADIPMPGIHMVYNALAATAVGRIYGLTLEQIRHGIETLEAISGRFHMIETDRFLIVDDCYNANPMSMKASLDVLKDGAGRRVAILGDMGELGENEVQLHAEVGEHAAQCGIDVCICTGPLSANIAKMARKNPELIVIEEPDRDSLLSHLSDYVQTGDTILVKASHFMQFEKVVAALQEM